MDWAVEAVFRTTDDDDFIRELYPKLVAHHEASADLEAVVRDIRATMD